jgi:putative salt-induced outer membrane protein YdiY
MNLRFVNALLLSFALAASASAQETPDDDASQRPCDNRAQFGFNSSQGNSETLAALVGADLCRQWKGGRWSADFDASVHRSDDVSAAERADLYLFRERQFRSAWVASLFGTAEVDRARGLDSRFMLGTGVGKLRQFKWRNGIHAGLHAGLGYTVTDERGGDEHAFPEAWSKLDLSARLTDDVTIVSAFHTFTNLEAANDTRVDAEANLALQITQRISLHTGVTLNYDYRPAEGADRFDLLTHTLLAFTWGKSGDR